MLALEVFEEEVKEEVFEEFEGGEDGDEGDGEDEHGSEFKGDSGLDEGFGPNLACERLKYKGDWGSKTVPARRVKDAAKTGAEEGGKDKARL